MNFSLEALYALHMISNNGFSEEIFLLPLPEIAEEEKLKQLKQVLEQGYEDLRNMGLIDENNEHVWQDVFILSSIKKPFHTVR